MDDKKTSIPLSKPIRDELHVFKYTYGFVNLDDALSALLELAKNNTVVIKE